MLFVDAVFNVFACVFHVTNCVSRGLGDVRQNVAVVLLFLYSIIRFELCFCRSVWCYAKPRCYYSCPYGVMRNLDAIVRVRMMLCDRELDRYGLARVIN